MVKSASYMAKYRIRIKAQQKGIQKPYQAGSSSDTKKDLKNMFEAAGFDTVNVSDDFPTPVAGAFALQLQNLEHKFGGVAMYKEYGDQNSVRQAALTTDDSGNAYGYYARQHPTGVTKNGKGTIEAQINLNPKLLADIKWHQKQLKVEQSLGFKVATNDNILSATRYTVTHEYGHLLQESIYKKAVAGGYSKSYNQFTGKMKREINAIAKRDYGATGKEPSSYGGTNSREFFAEAFTSMNLGKPNAHGMATRDWLKKNGYI